MIAKLRTAGAIFLGKTNLDEYAPASIARSTLGGQTCNPYDTKRVPGGSSAGSGAAVAANLAMCALGTDTSGSVRFPSTANALVGMVATQGLVSRAGIIPLSFSRDRGGPMCRTGLVAFLSAIFYTPLALGVLYVTRLEIGAVELGLMAGSAVLHSVYFILLNQGYRVGDLSLVYPLARGTGPLLSTIAAILLLGERPSALAVCGALLIIGGVVVITSNPKSLRQSGVKTAVLYAAVTGVFIAAYTLWDKQAVSRFALPSLILDWGANLGRAILLTSLPARYP
jgi:drug/metabolite transporter (DMT)-like permease